MKHIAIQSNKALPFDTSRGIEGIVTINIRFYQRSNHDTLYIMREYSCKYEDEEGVEQVATLPEKPKEMHIDEINGLAQYVNASSMLKNENFLLDFDKVIQIGLLMATKKECADAIEKDKMVNFNSTPDDWELVLN